MLTRLHVKGFKNLPQNELFFGPLTCLSGAPGAGKSSLADAIQFLALLAGGSIQEAVAGVAQASQPNQRAALLRHKGSAARIELDCDVLIEPMAHDPEGREVQATCNHLRYQLRLKWTEKKGESGCFEIEEEQLGPALPDRQGHQLHFPHANHWRTSLLTPAVPRETLFIQTRREKAGRVVAVVPDRIPAKPIEVLADNLKATVLSSCPSDFPTAWLVAREMQRWLITRLDCARLPQDEALKTLCHRLDQQITQGDGSDWRDRLSADFQELGGEEVRFQPDDSGTPAAVYKNGLSLPLQAMGASSRRLFHLLAPLADRAQQHLLFIDDVDLVATAENSEALYQRLNAFTSDVEDFYDPANPLRQVIFVGNHRHLIFQCAHDAWLRAETTAPGHSRFGFPRGTWRVAAQQNGKGWSLSKWGEPPLKEETGESDTQVDQDPKPSKRKSFEHPLLPFEEYSA